MVGIILWILCKKIELTPISLLRYLRGRQEVAVVILDRDNPGEGEDVHGKKARERKGGDLEQEETVSFLLPTISKLITKQKKN